MVLKFINQKLPWTQALGVLGYLVHIEPYIVHLALGKGPPVPEDRLGKAWVQGT
jgi:hypothetical protein